MAAHESQRRPRRLEDLTPAEIAPVEKLFEPGYPEQTRAIARVLYVELLNLEVPVPELLAIQLADAVRVQLGGQPMYMNKGVIYEADQRARQILAEYDGNNLPELARKHNLTHERVRQIVAPEKAAREARARAIGAAFTGRNARALAAQHGLRPDDVERLVREDPVAREAQFQARQGALPLES